MTVRKQFFIQVFVSAFVISFMPTASAIDFEFDGVAPLNAPRGGLEAVGHYMSVADWCQKHGWYKSCDDLSRYASAVKTHRNLKPAIVFAALNGQLAQTGQMHVYDPSSAGEEGLVAPSNLTISEVSNHALRLNWLDNATVEYGVWVERGNPVEARGGINYQWKPVFKVEERSFDLVEGTGWRSDGDDGLRAGTEYCYRLRAYTNKALSGYSKPACATTLSDNSSGSPSGDSSFKPGEIPAPSHLTVSEVSRTSLTLNWTDNATNEYGVSVQRGTPIEARGGINYQWKTVFHVEERVDSRVKGTGLRSDGDNGLNPNTEYCYRLRAFYMKQVSAYSEPVCTRTNS
jgi:hypothetical protein